MGACLLGGRPPLGGTVEELRADGMMGVPRFSVAGARGGVRKVLIDSDEDGVADT